MQSVAGISYNCDKPRPFWFFVGKIVSNALFGIEEDLEWLNTVIVWEMKFISFANTQYIVSNQGEEGTTGEDLRVVEVEFPKPQQGGSLNLFWKPTRAIIR